MKKFTIFAVLLSIGLMSIHLVSACGGFFCTNTPIDQTAERIIFTINGDDTISAIVGINYTGAAEDFSWVVPVPAPPELDVAPTESLDIIQNATNPQINPPYNYCRGVIWSQGGGGGGGGGFLEEGNLGPYDYAIIASDDPRELIEWLRDNGYRITEDMEPIIGEYVAEGMYFLAMKLSNDAEVGDIQPVKMTYPSTNPMIPLRLTAVAALDNMPVLVWIFADQPYSPDNYGHPDVDFASFRTRSQLVDPFGFSDATNDYFNERNRIQDEFDGRAFITEYAMPSINLIEINASVVDDAYLMDLINQFPFVTRLRAQISPEQMTIDPIFLPDARQNHVPQTIELEDHLDPLHYWGCSNRENDQSDEEELLPNVSELPNNLTFRYPAGWIQSPLVFRDISIFAYAPQPVTPDILEAYFEGQSDFPIVLRLAIPSQEFWDWYIFRDVFDLADDYLIPDGNRILNMSYNKLFTDNTVSELMFLILTTSSDYAENIQVYNAMQSHLDSYEYATHPQLRHTLALSDEPDDVVGVYGTIPPLLMGFPEGWTEFLQADGRIVIVPDDGSSPQIELQQSTAFSNIRYPEQDIPNDGLLDTFGFDEATLDALNTFSAQNCHLTPVTEYERNGRVGFFRAIRGWVVTVSSVSGEFEANRELMQWIAESVVNPYGCILG